MRWRRRAGKLLVPKVGGCGSEDRQKVVGTGVLQAEVSEQVHLCDPLADRLAQQASLSDINWGLFLTCPLH